MTGKDFLEKGKRYRNSHGWFVYHVSKQEHLCTIGLTPEHGRYPATVQSS